MESRHSAWEPQETGSPNGADAYQGERESFVTPAPATTAAAEAADLPRMMLVDERPLSAEDCAIGEVVAGKYLVEGVIGRGSMGVVVRATHLGFDELVALKFIRPEMRAIDGIRSRFAREAKASVRIRNEHAVNVLDVGVAEPLGPFFVMEYLEGINLEELVDSQGAFDRSTAVKFVLEACEALAAAHAQGIIHRDIKPQNMFLAWQGRLELIKVLDFGISKAALRGQMFGDDLSNTEKDWVMGTPLYMSPEQLRNSPDVDERTDVWSLGAVLYELLCGEPLFSGDTQTAVCRQVLEVETRSIRVAMPGVPDVLWEIIERCLSVDKEHRFANVAELGEALLPFAPPGAVLHVERARALLGLRPMDFLESADDIEDIDVDPIEETEPAAAVPVAVVPPSASRRTYWVELAVPALACAVLWLGMRQWELSHSSVDKLTDVIETQTYALQAQPQCPAPAPIVVQALPPAPPAPVAPAEPVPKPAPAPSAPAPRSHASPARAAAPAVPAAVAPAPAAPVPAAQSQLFSAELPMESATGSDDGSADEHAAPPQPKAPRPRPKAEPKLEFRLIDENPRPPAPK